MKIVYITNTRFPTRKAYGINVIKTCEALARNGVEVTLIVPSYKRDSGGDGVSCFAAKKEFATHVIKPWIDGVAWGRAGFWINRIVFTLFVLQAKEIGTPGEKTILTRDDLSGWILRRLGHTVFYDLHGFSYRKKRFWEQSVRNMSGVIVTSQSKVSKCVEVLGVPFNKIVVAPNGFDPALFDFKINKETLREQLRLPKDKKIATYAGHLYDWKGVFVLAETAAFLPDVHFVFVGGMPWDIENFKKKYGNMSNIDVVGYRPNEEVPKYLKASDVLILPNSAASCDKEFAAHSESDTSPIKLFEYMASGVPIVASDLPSIRDFLNEKNAVLVTPDNVGALRRGIEKTVKNHLFAERVAKNALLDSKKYTWEKRTIAILELINRVSIKIS